MIRRFLAVVELPEGLGVDRVRAALEEVAEASHELGIRPIDTFYTLEGRRAYTLFEAGSEGDVRCALAAPRLPVVDVVPGDVIHTELLDEPRRDRYA